MTIKVVNCCTSVREIRFEKKLIGLTGERPFSIGQKEKHIRQVQCTVAGCQRRFTPILLATLNIQILSYNICQK